ncbi:MAG: FlgD immunoglobulin-like domain containing protein, partial [bacterium]
PFNPKTTIEYDLPQDTHVVLTIYNLLGQKIRTLVDEDQKVRSHTVIWTGVDDAGRSVASGLYIYKLQAGSFVDIKKMLLIK